MLGASSHSFFFYFTICLRGFTTRLLLLLLLLLRPVRWFSIQAILLTFMSETRYACNTIYDISHIHINLYSTTPVQNIGKTNLKLRAFNYFVRADNQNVSHHCQRYESLYYGVLKDKNNVLVRKFIGNLDVAVSSLCRRSV